MTRGTVSMSRKVGVVTSVCQPGTPVIWGSMLCPGDIAVGRKVTAAFGLYTLCNKWSCLAMEFVKVPKSLKPGDLSKESLHEVAGWGSTSLRFQS